jgi:hypothetical protein
MSSYSAVMLHVIVLNTIVFILRVITLIMSIMNAIKLSIMSMMIVTMMLC